MKPEWAPEGEYISRREYHSRALTQAVEDFSGHELIAPGGKRSWRIKNPSHGNHWAEIVVMGGTSAITVWGDIELCCFAYCSGTKSPEGVVRWMSTANVDYAREKAAIGSGFDMYGYDESVARWDLYSHYEDAVRYLDEDADCYPKGDAEYFKKEWKHAIRRALNRTYEKEAMHAGLLEDLSDVESDAWEWVYGVGRVVSTRVLYALAAIKRLDQILTERGVLPVC